MRDCGGASALTYRSNGKLLPERGRSGASESGARSRLLHPLREEAEGVAGEDLALLVVGDLRSEDFADLL